MDTAASIVYRIILWDSCFRSCPGCCNQDSMAVNAPYMDEAVTEEDMKNAKAFMLTGGEPLMYPRWVHQMIRLIRFVSKAPIILYTAETGKNTDISRILDTICAADGVTVTLHEQEDVKPFLVLAERLWYAFANRGKSYSLRLNVFSGVTISDPSRFSLEGMGWKLKTGISWKKNCPLPKGEKLVRVNPTFWNPRSSVVSAGLSLGR